MYPIYKIRYNDILVEPGFQWKQAKGKYTLISDMNDKHVFYTWLMLWNHNCKPEHKIWENNKYALDKAMHISYQIDAFKQLWLEVIHRTEKGCYGFKTVDVIGRINQIIKHTNESIEWFNVSSLEETVGV